MEAFLLGFGGGVLVQFLLVAKFQFDVPRDLPPYLKAWLFWVIAGLYAVAGGFMAALMNGDNPITNIVALQIGAAWPLVIQRASEVIPERMTDTVQ